MEITEGQVKKICSLYNYILEEGSVSIIGYNSWMARVTTTHFAKYGEEERKICIFYQMNNHVIIENDQREKIIKYLQREIE